ncbi:DsbA family protein [Gordonia sp. PDNC005]|uniref:DsbA family protein n=1 Tax=unclassified Gordonia (in: high G+C Gram-positive bacteria) TaxID=2657482 RepID=UPI00196530EB|nr:thioredoxin domain-containing protein [Gordonia sp. PDNC005]QRY61592.1 DsbA family protein [Gordonia sp. PDNC005]
MAGTSRARLVLILAAVVFLSSCSTDGRPVRAANEPFGGDDQTTSTTDAPGDDESPAKNGEAFRVFAGTGAPKVTVTVIADLACPACKVFESTFGPVLDAYRGDPDVAVDYRVISFLDRMSSDRYSSRAANASHCVWHAAEATPAHTQDWREFQSIMFENQPPEGGPGLSTTQLAQFATTAGMPSANRCILESKRSSDVSAVTRAVTNDPTFQGTPTVKINGDTYTPTTPTALKSAIDQAKRN